MNTVLLIVIGLCLYVLFTVEIAAVAIRLIGGVCGIAHLAGHSANLILLLSRVSTAICLVCIGYELDKGVSTLHLLITYLFFTTLWYLTLRIWERNICKINGFLIKNIAYINKIDNIQYVWEETLSSDKDCFFRWNVVVGVFLVLGFCLPSYFASVHHEYRATLLQLGFLLNSIATLITAFFIERRIAIALHNDEKKLTTKLQYSYISSRALSAKYSAFFLISIIVSYV